MLVRSLSIEGFRNLDPCTVELEPGVTVVHGPNGAGKTNLLEALYFGCTARSCRTNTAREAIRFGAATARVELEAIDDEDDPHSIAVGLGRDGERAISIDGVGVDRLTPDSPRPLVSVFLPDRLELVKGSPGVRRGHLDQLLTALWPSRAESRGAYLRALAQRNALLGRIRAGLAPAAHLDPWDRELARAGSELSAARAEAAGLLGEPFATRAHELGLPRPAEVAHRPRGSCDAEGLAAELLERREDDVRRGFTDHGPHRDDLALLHDGRSLRSYGSQGQQRSAVLALLFAERDVLLAARRGAPLMLLDDVLSELDAERRTALVELLATGGQAVVTTTDLGHLPESVAGVRAIRVADGVVAEPVPAAHAGAAA